MKKRLIRNTGVELTPIMFGTSALGDMPDTYGYGVDEARARMTLRAILEGPVNCLDTSNNYGFGRSEQRVGDAILERGGLPEGFVISTKLDRDMKTGKFDAGRARKSLEESLTRLNLDRVQILHLHDPEHSAEISEITGPGGALDELFKMKEEGLCDAVGLAMGRVDIMLPILKDRQFDLLINHNRWTLLNRSANETYDYAHSQGMVILNAAPYASGVLAKGSAKMPMISYTPADDKALKPVRAIEDVCKTHGVAVGPAALQFSMNDPRIGSTLIGVTKPERVQETLDWADAQLPDSLWKELSALPYETDDPEERRNYKPG